jgi:DnaJ family protein C protein 28
METSHEKDPAEKPATEEGKPRVPLPGKWSSTMDELIEEAMRRGDFDNLPGKGKPLNLSKNPFAQDTELAYQLLKDNDYTLPWIAERKEVFRQIEVFREKLNRVWLRFRGEYRAARSETVQMSLSLGWHERLTAWERQLKALNQRIGDVNLKQPDGQTELLKLSLDNELARIGAGRELG